MTALTNVPARLADLLGNLTAASLAPSRTTVARGAAATLARRIQARHLVIIDLLGIMVAAYVALALRYDALPGPGVIGGLLPAIGLLLAVRTVVDVRLGLYSRGWRFASIPDVVRIVAAVVAGTIATIVLYYGVSFVHGSAPATNLPRSFWPAEMLLSIAILGGARFLIRAANDWAPRVHSDGEAEPRRTLLYGAGRTGVLMARSAERNPGAGVEPVGFLDDDRSLTGKFVAGLKVYGGREHLAAVAHLTGAHTLLITMPGAPGRVVRPIVDAALQLGLEVRTVPPLTDLLDGTIDARRMRRVRVEDLLRRPIVTEHDPSVDQIVRDRVVMITGAAGSIGSELARQVYALSPRALVLVDRAESPLYLLQRELETRRGHGQGAGELRVHLVNVTNRRAMEHLVAGEAPSVIFHAAAYKHVPMMESHPSDALYVNVAGTQAVLDAAEHAGVERVVLVSTDKAVRPSSVMGASKRVAEMLVADAARRTGLPYVSVRFGNVLGSNGSVVPIFQEQLENGEPLTITDVEMTRFFMTIPEAAWLILDAAAIGRSGDLFVLDMGEPVRIMDLANDLVRLAGRDPASQPVRIVGLRPGEKLHEELFYASERVQPTQNPKVLRVATDAPPAEVREEVERLLGLATGDHEDLLRRALLQYTRRLDKAPAPSPDSVQALSEDWAPASPALPGGSATSASTGVPAAVGVAEP